MAGALKADWLERAAPVAGLIGPAAIGACSVAAAIAYRGRDDELYFPLNHFVSELGELDVSALAVLFNSGLIVGGLCFATFMVGFGRMRGGLGGTAYAVLGALAGIAGAAVGVFPMNAIRVHTIAASAFFDLAWIAVAIASVDLLVRPDGRFQARLAALGFGAVAAVVAFIWAYAFAAAARGSGLQPPPARPSVDVTSILEWVALISVIAWTSAVALAWRRAQRVGAT